MYQIKQSPDDFIVKEISNLELKPSGLYSICLLKKTNYTTIRALEQLARSLNKQLKDFGYAGTKDKNAVTEQYISIKATNKDFINQLRLKDIELSFMGYADNPISLGFLTENEFTITVRNLSEDDIKKIQAKSKCMMPNYFGEQRFSKNNIEIGRSLIKRDYKKAIELIISSNSDYQDEIKTYAEKKDYAAALRVLPKKLLTFYLHAYQSYLWNKTLTAYLKTSKDQIELPIIGFGTETEHKVLKPIIENIIDQEALTYRSFINRSIPELSSEGTLRQAFTEIKDFKILEKTNDSIKISFKLNKGSYATVAIAFLFDCLNDTLKDLL
jgi:tRNA pseudouridine13 synthase